MKRIMLLAPALLLMYINSFAGGTTGGNSPLAVVANFTASVTTGCAPLATQFTSTSTSDAGDPIVSYSWDFGDGSPLSNAVSPTHIYTSQSPSGGYDVKLTVTTQSGATNTTTKAKYIVSLKPVADLGPDIVVCEGEITSLQTTPMSGYTYTWGGGALSTTWNAQVTPSAGAHIYWVETSDGTCTARDTINVTADPVLSPNWGYKVSNNCGNVEVVFQDSSKSCDPSNVLEVLWSFDGGNNWVDGPTVTHIFPTGGPQTISYYISEKNSYSDYYEEYTITLPNPTPGPSPIDLGGDKTICQGNSVQLDAGDEPGATYAWSPSTGLSSTSIYNPVASPSSTQTYSVTKTKCGIPVTGTVTVNVNPSLTVNLGADASICSGDPVTIDAGNAGATYSWSPGGATTQTITVNPTTNTTYTVTVTKGGCSATGSKNITVNAKPVVNLGADASICSGDAVTLDAGNAGATYLWSPGGATTQTITVNPTTNTTYTVTVTKGGCSGTGSKNITVNAKPVVNLGADVSICSGDPVTIDAGSHPGATYSWAPGGATTQSVTDYPTVNTTYKVTVTKDGCSNDGLANVTVKAKPVVNITANNVSICSGNPVTIDAGSHPGATYIWNPGGETTQTINVNPSETTAYTVMVTKDGCSASGTIVLNRTKAAAASFTYTQSGDASCGPYTVNVTENATLCSGSVKEHYWDFGDGTIVQGSYNKFLSHNYTIPGNHLIRLIVTTDSGVKDTTQQIVSFTGSGFTIDLGRDTTLCGGASITLDAGAGSSYAWSNGETTRTITVDQSGEYSVVVYNGTCYATGKINITAIAALSVDLGKDTTICGGTLILDAGNPGATYLWNANAGSAVSQTVTVTPQNGTNIYTVDVHKGTCTGSGSITVTLNAAIQVHLGNDTAICTGTTLLLDAGYPGAVYSWQDGATSQTYPASAAGKYKVSVDDHGCKGDGEINITLVTAPSAVNLGDDINKCFGNSVTLDAGDYPGATYLWSTGATTRTLDISASGTYSVAVSGCGVTQPDEINVILHNLTAPVITQSGLELICTDADSYQWYKDGILIPGATFKKYKPRGYGKYAVMVTYAALECAGKSDDYWFTPDGQYYLQEIRVIATPNPSNGLSKLVLSKLPPKPIKVSVYDRIGRKILVTTVANTVTDLNLASYAKGLYFVECVLDDQKLIIPIVTQ